MAARPTDRGGSANGAPPVVALLRGTLRQIRARSAVDPVTVVTPSIYSAFYLRRSLAADGLFNVRFTRLEDLAEELAGPGDRPALSHLAASELIHAAAAEAAFRLPGIEAVRMHPTFHAALHRTFTELETAPATVVEAIEGADHVRRALVGLYRAYEAKAAAYERRTGLVERAVRNLHRRGGAWLPGPVVVTAIEPPPPAYRPLHDLLLSLPDVNGLPAAGTTIDFGATRCVSAPDPAGEVASTVRDLVSACSETPFSRMAVFFTDPAYGRRLREALALAGVPVSGPDETPLAERPGGRFLDLALGALTRGGFELARKELIDWLATSPVRPSRAEASFHASRWDAVSRNAGITRGLDEWRKRLESYASRQEEHGRRRFDLGEIDESTANALRAEAREARDLSAFVLDLAGSSRPPGSPATWGAYAAWAGSLIERHLDEAAAGPGSAEGLMKLMRTIAALDEAGGPRPDVHRFVAVVRRELSQTTGGGHPLGQGVFVAPIRFAAGTDFDLVHVVGMVEGAYPPAPLDDPLLPDEVRARVDPDGHLDRRQTRQERERRRFAGALAAGRARVLSWPRAEPGATRHSWPSRWFVEAARSVSGLPRLQSGDLFGSEPPGVEVVPVADRALGEQTPERCADSHELDLRSLLAWRAEAGPVAEHFVARLDGGLLARGVRLERARRSAEWTEYDGNLTSVAEGPTAGGRPISATSLEIWSACPFRYFLGHALRVRALPAAEEAFEISPLDRGALIHRILQDYFERTSRGGPGSVEERRSTMAEVVQAGLDRAETVYVTGRRVMWRLERERIARDLLAFVDQEAERAARLGVRQRHAEFAFGIAPGGPGPVQAELPGGRTVLFRGVIDRVELSEDGSRAVVVDYKTGGAESYDALRDDPIDRGRRLQLPVYAEAVRSGLPGVKEAGAQYWFVSERGGYRLVPESPVTAREAMLSAVAAITDGIASGVFVPRPGARKPAGGFDNCQICSFDPLCTSARERQWALKATAPGLAGYRALAEGPAGSLE